MGGMHADILKAELRGKQRPFKTHLLQTYLCKYLQDFDSHWRDVSGGTQRTVNLMDLLNMEERLGEINQVEV